MEQGECGDTTRSTTRVVEGYFNQAVVVLIQQYSMNHSFIHSLCCCVSNDLSNASNPECIS